MNCSDFVRARKGGHHPEQSLTTYDSAGLFPFLCLTDNILSLARFFKHRMTDWGAIPAAAALSFGCTHSSIRPHSLCYSAASTLLFGRIHSVIRPYPLCHPDRSGGISSSWHKTLLLHSGLQVWVLVCRRSFGCAQDDRLGCHSGRPYFFILWVAFRAANQLTSSDSVVIKVLLSLFSAGIIFNGLTVSALLALNLKATAYSLTQVGAESASALRFINDWGTGAAAEMSLVGNPIMAAWWLVVAIMLFGKIWQKKA